MALKAWNYDEEFLVLLGNCLLVVNDVPNFLLAVVMLLTAAAVAVMMNIPLFLFLR